MLPTQWSEIQARYRRFLRTVGQQTLAADEVVSPTLHLGAIGEAPYRSDPVAFFGIAVADGAVAPARNNVVLSVGPASGATLNGEPWVAVVRYVCIVLQEPITAGQGAALALGVGYGVEPAGVATTGQPVVIEPVDSDDAGSLPFSLSIAQIRVKGNVAGANDFPAIFREITRKEVLAGAQQGWAEFFLNPPVVLRPRRSGIANQTAMLAAAALGVDAGAASIAMRASFAGEFYQLYPAR